MWDISVYVWFNVLFTQERECNKIKDRNVTTIPQLFNVAQLILDKDWKESPSL